jgi:hypothetical protein
MKPSRDIPDEFLGVAEQLESHRPQLSGLDADRVKLRAMANGAKTATRNSTKGTFMRSRLAITSMLAFGVLMTSSGAALGVSALSTTPSASQAQYGTSVTVEDEGVLGDTAEDDLDSGGLDDGGPTLGGDDPDGDVLGDTASGDEGGGGDVAGTTTGGSGDVAGTSAGDSDDPAQAARQLESGGGGELPFTGYAAVPTLLIGIGLLAMGLILRRNPGRQAAQS